VRFAKGHGTGNDFVVLPDLDGALSLTPGAVRALCDRRHGVGGDGVLRVVATAKVGEVAHLAAEADWFMDYHNADGTTAEMCGNGIRVYARWLQRSGRAGEGSIPVATRDGVKTVHLPADEYGDITVDMGAPHIPGTTRQVRVADGSRGSTYDGLEIWMGNPHIVVRVDDLGEAGALLVAPTVDPQLETNVEFVVDHGSGHLSMRVHERGSGETQSCGTGACAAGVAAALSAGAGSGQWTVDVPGGRLRVEWTGETVLLSGPAVIVADGDLDNEWLAAAGIRP
jgi:diaminopimelate epimerase